jgi:ribonuclease HII
MKNKSFLYTNDKKYFSKGCNNIGGVASIGQDCIAGPIVTALVIFPSTYKNPEINYSKIRNEKTYELLYKQIKANAIYCETKFVSPDEIDKTKDVKTNIHNSIADLINESNNKADIYLVDQHNVIVDNNKIADINKNNEKFQCVCAANIIAWVEKNEYMKRLHKSFPYYYFNKNNGRLTKLHTNAIKKYGIVKHVHRKTFIDFKTK